MLTKGRRTLLIGGASLLCSLTMWFMLPLAHNSVFGYKADSVAEYIADDLWSVRQLARLRSHSQMLEFDTLRNQYTVPELTDGMVARRRVDLSKWPFSAKLVTANFGDSAVVKFNGWGGAASAGEVVINVAGHRRRIALEPTLGRTSIETLPPRD